MATESASNPRTVLITGCGPQGLMAIAIAAASGRAWVLRALPVSAAVQAGADDGGLALDQRGVDVFRKGLGIHDWAVDDVDLVSELN